jgi:putative ABC transport system permease protein
MGGYRHTDDSDASFQVSEGRALKTGDENIAVAGKSLLRSLSLKLGRDIDFLTMRKEGALDGTGFSLVGSFVTFMKAFDERTLFVPIQTAQKLLGSPDTVTYLLLLLDRTENTEKTLAEIKRWIRGKGLPFEALAWHEQAEYYHQCRLFLDTIFRSVMLLFGAIFAFTLYNMINMAIKERTKEFGTMMALGNDRNLILGMILLEAVFLGLSGAIFGAILGGGLGTVISWIGIPMPPPPQGSEPYQALIALSPRLILYTMGLTVASCVVGAVLPAFQSSRQRIVAALGFA